METKHCNGCGENKELTEFYVRKSGPQKGQLRNPCKQCEIRQGIERDNSNPEKRNKREREYKYRNGAKPAAENKSCAAYLGCVVAETILSHEFLGFKRMPNGNPGYDYICPNKFKIDVKSSCRHQIKRGNDNWRFKISRNKVANYFLFLAFGDRDKPLEPEHVWMIPGNVVNENCGITITDSSDVLAKWSQYERSLGNVTECCSKLRGGQ